MITINIPQMISICLLCFGTGILVAAIIQSVIDVIMREGAQNE